MTNLYQMTVPNYKRVLQSTISVLKSAKAYFAEQGKSVDELLDFKLAEDMLPLSFQIKSVRHHSLHSIEGVIAQEFTVPEPSPEETVDDWISALEVAHEKLSNYTESEINDCENKGVTFKMTNLELPFTAENFVMSFSIPNLYFHAATVYNIMRMHGVPIGKRDFLGEVAVGAPNA